MQQFSSVIVNYAWTPEPGVIMLLVILSSSYVWRWRTVRGSESQRGAPTLRLLAYVAGILMIFTALISPVDTLAEQLFSMHMGQHILLVDAAPILLLLGLNRPLLRPVTRRLHRFEQAAGPLAHPAVGVTVYVGSLWFWHLPPLYDAALEHVGWHAVEHIQFLGSGLWYWWFVVKPIPPRLPLRGLGLIFYVGLTRLLVGVLGTGLTFYPHLLYTHYANQEVIWGVAPITDQGIGGAIMMLEGSILLLVVLFVAFGQLLEQSEREAQRQERFENV